MNIIEPDQTPLSAILGRLFHVNAVFHLPVSLGCLHVLDHIFCQDLHAEYIKIYFYYQTDLLPSGHMTSIQRRLNVDATSWPCIDVEATLYKRHVSAGWTFEVRKKTLSFTSLKVFRSATKCIVHHNMCILFSTSSNSSCTDCLFIYLSIYYCKIFAATTLFMII